MLATQSIGNLRSAASLTTGPSWVVSGRVAWLSGLCILALLLAVLALAVRAAPASGFERTILDWVARWWAPGLRGAFTVISFFSGGWRAIAISGALVAVLRITGRARQAVAVAIASGAVGLGALITECGLAHVTGQTRRLTSLISASPAATREVRARTVNCSHADSHTGCPVSRWVPLRPVSGPELVSGCVVSRHISSPLTGEAQVRVVPPAAGS